MCITHDQLSNAQRWNWDGDIIVPDSIVNQARRVLGTRRRYDVDIREFLVSKDNAVMRKKLAAI